MKVTPQNVSNINNLLSNPKQQAVLKFYADWCGHCQTLNKEAWPEVEHKCKKKPGDGLLINIPEPMISQLNDSIAKDVKGYPTITAIIGGGKKIDYNGKRDAKNIMKFINKNLKNRKTRFKNKKTRRKKRKKKTKKRRRKRKNKNKSRSNMRERFFRMITLK